MGIVHEVAVDGISVFVLAQMHPVRFDGNGTITLLQEDNIRHNLGTGIGFERIVRQTDSTKELRPFSQILSYFAARGIHGVAAGHKGQHTTGAKLIQRLGEEVVVNGKAQPVIGWVVDLILPKGNITDSQIEEVTAIRLFKTGNGDVCLGVKLLGNPAGDGIQFHTVKAAVTHLIGEHTEEVAHTHRRFQDITALEAHVSNSFIHGLDYCGAGIVSVQRRASCCGIFLWGKGFVQFDELVCPVGLAFVKGICKTAPTNISGQDFLFFRCCLPTLKLQLLQQLDGIHIHTKLGLGTTHTQIIVCNAEVFCFGKLLGRFRFFRADRLHHHIVGQIVVFTGIDRNGVRDEFRGFFRCCRGFCRFHFFYVVSHKGNGFCSEDRESGSVGKGNVLKVDGTGGKIHPINHKGSAVDLKSGLARDQIFLGKCFIGKLGFIHLGSNFRLFSGNHGNVALIHVPLKVRAFHADRLLPRFAGHGVPHIIFIHMVDDHTDFGVSIKGRNQMIAGMIYLSVLGSEDHRFRQTVLSLHLGKEVNGSSLFSKTEKLPIFTVVFLNGSIEDTGDAPFIGQQTDRKPVGIFFRRILFRNGFRIPHNLLDKGRGVQFVSIHHLSVYDPVFCQPFPDGNGINIVHAVIFFLGVEFFRFDKLGNPFLHLGPGKFHLLIAAHTHIEGVGTILELQPSGGASFPFMLLHIPDNCSFTDNITVPCLDSGINFRLCCHRAEYFGFRCHRRSFLGLLNRLRRREHCHGIGIAVSAGGILGGDRHGIFGTQFFYIPFQILGRYAAHLDATGTGNVSCGEGQIQHDGGLLGIFAVHFKEITHLIQNNFVGMCFLDGIIVPDRVCCRFLSNRFRIQGGSFLRSLGSSLFCIQGFLLGKLLRGEESPGSHEFAHALGNF